MKKISSATTLLAILLSVAGIAELTGQENPLFQLVGFASVGDGTTGGAGGDTVIVSTGNALQDALEAKKDSNTPLVIVVKGLINQANSIGLNKIDVKEVNDVTILGDDKGAEFDGIGIKIRRASNIIIRNLKIHHVAIGEKDCIGIEGPADHIWIDHCELYNEYQGADKDYYDGLLDAKADAEYITYSWNFLHDSWKTALVGSSESDTFDRKLTMHHNYFLNCNSRLPLFRGSTGHFFNNYFKDITSTTINTRINACVLIQNNYFENANNPWVSAYSNVLGGADTMGNILVNSPFKYSGDTHQPYHCSPTIPYAYEHVLHSAELVPELVMQFAGVGKLDLEGNHISINAPSSLSAIAVSHEQIDLAWTDNSDNESGFIIERMKEGGSFSEIASLEPDSKSYSDTGLEAFTSYTYRIKAYVGPTESDWSESASAITLSTGFTETTQNLILVYPNPAREKLTIRTSRPARRITVYSIDGVRLMDQEYAGQQEVILDLERVAPGICFFRIELSEEICTGRFVKE